MKDPSLTLPREGMRKDGIRRRYGALAVPLKLVLANKYL